MSIYVLFCLLAATSAHAAGMSSPPPPPPPAVSFDALPASAAVRPETPDDEQHPVLARLVTEDAALVPGTTARIGIHLSQDKDWHTYWKAPGDIGLPTEIRWSLPEGFVASPHAYPVPQRFEQDGLISFGYDDQVLLISELTVPSDHEGDVTLHADVEWLVCKTLCIPGGASLSLTVPTADVTTPSPVAPLFPHYAGQFPTDPLDVHQFGWDVALSSSAVRPYDTFHAVFLFKPTSGEPFASVAENAWPTFTPIGGGFDWLLSDQPTVKLLDDGSVLVTLAAEALEPEPLPTDARIGGLVQLNVGDQLIQTEVSSALPWAEEGAQVSPGRSPLLALAGLESAATPQEPASAATMASVEGVPFMSLVTNLGLAFIGGLILNIMPCVLPVLTLKLYGLIEQADISNRERQQAGLAYTAGILFSFVVLAATIWVARMVVGVDIGWGFQFQYPPYVAALATIVFVFGLSLFGVFEIPAIGAASAGEAAAKEGLAGYFLTGVFATVLGTPCSAPFLGTAIAYAFATPPAVLVSIFVFVGLGLAFPFLAVAFVPALFRFLPRPGPWMDVGKQLLGFSLIATAIWLVDVLSAQIGPDRTTGFLVFLFFAGFAAWAFGRFAGVAASGRRQLAVALFALGLTTAAGAKVLDLDIAEEEVCDDGGDTNTSLSFEEHIPWQPFSEDRVAALAGHPIFIDFTADWCLTCKANEHAVLETEPVRQAMADHGIIPLKADWTRRNPVITEWLRRNNRAGVPMYLFIPSDANQPHVLLPEVITQSMVVSAIEALD